MNNNEIIRTYRLYEEFFRFSREAMFITSKEGKYLKVNNALGKLLGYELDELVGLEVLKTFDIEEDRTAYQKLIEEKGVVHQYPLVLKRKDGTPIPCFIDAIAWHEGGRIMGYHGIIRSRADLFESFKNFFNQLKTEREQIKKERKNLISDTMLLSRYISDEVLDYALHTGKNPLETGRRKVTVLFFDIRGSTRIAEKVAPEAFAELLNDILTDIIDLVYGCKGSVNKIIGDGLMATFGAPVASDNDQVNAVQAAQEIFEYLKTFNDVRPDFLTEPIQAGLGLATGMVFAGIIGSVRRQEYTVLGDAVNIASRLESLTRSSPAKVLMDEETYLAVKDVFPARKIFSGQVRGRAGTLLIYGLNSSRES
jgi:PAS domain S-box-containing protein